MKKYRLISVWNEAYVPRSYRQDGVKQERVELSGLTLEEASVKFYELFNPLIKEGWTVDRYENDDGLYKNFELIGQDYKIAPPVAIKITEPAEVEIVEPVKKEPIEAITIEVAPTQKEEAVVLDIAPIETITIEPEPKISRFYDEIISVKEKSKAAKAANEPFCRCLYEIENNLIVSNYCEMSCKDQSIILQKRKQEKRLKESESSTGSKSCE